MPARRTSVRARRCRGERPRFASRTPRGAKRRSTTARSRAASKPPDESFSHARSGPASARPPTSTRSGTERPGSSAKWRNTLARRVCEYLSAAAKAIAKDAAALDAWMNAQKEALKTGRLDQALAALAGHIEAPEVDDDQAPVRRCHRYLSGRRNHLNYHDALANDLPIGSGEIESAHRYIAQQRLKRPGAWW